MTLEATIPQEPLSPTELGEKSFKAFESIKLGFIAHKNSALKDMLFKKAFSGNTEKGFSFDMNGSSYSFDIEESSVPFESEQEDQIPVNLCSRRVAIKKTTDGNTITINLASSWDEKPTGVREFKLGGISVVIDDLEDKDSEKAYDKLHDIFGEDIHPKTKSHI